MREKLTSLLIDPDRDRRNQFYLALDLLNISKACVAQDNTTRALEYLKKQSGFTPDYIFLDSLQPSDEAILFLREVRKVKRLKQVPLIWYAASFEPAQQEAIREAGFAAGLAKQDNLHKLKENLKVLFQSELQETLVPDELSAATRFKMKMKEVFLQTQSLLEAPEHLLTHP
ncbi:response regulator [Chitinophaga sp.]|uniref:response regulator n=1 Tax=Chitinophaga sp. TaxID=1869181 RepID=UPI002F93C7B5